MIRSFLKGGIFYKTPQLHENASISKDSDIVNKWYVDTKVNNTQIDTKQYVDTKVSNAQTAAKQYTDSTQASTKQYVDSRVASIPIINTSSFVNTSGNQNIYDTKYFNSSPTVPNPTSGTHAANKAYVDSKTSSGSYAQSLGSSGWTKLPNGLIIQWGRTQNIDKGKGATVTFPITFPNRVCTVVLTRQSNLTGTGRSTFMVAHLFRTEMVVTNGSDYYEYAYYIAIGY